MKELNQQYHFIQRMPLKELVEYANIIQESIKEMENDMEDAKSKMNSGASKFKFRR